MADLFFLMLLVFGTVLWSFGLSEINLMRNAMVEAESIDELYTKKWGFPYLAWTDYPPYLVPTTVWIPLQNAFDACAFMVGIGVALSLVGVWGL